MDRTPVNRPMMTGIAGIDLIYPIGRGQRQLIIGDKKTGKTQIALDTIVNQGKIMKEKSNKNDIICIYIAVGKTKKEIKTIYNELLRRNALSYTMIVAATNDDKTTVQSLIPYVGLSIAEEYMMQKKDVVVVIDDLKSHAESYREISLISNKAPGREAYPADIFFLHSRLLEKGCQHKCGGSITILPIVETKGGDITDYISTNIISITDGQIVLSEKQFKKGQKPAINYGVSVSRLGGAVQTNEMKKLGSSVRLKLLSYLETKEVYELANMDEMSQELREKMKKGKEIEQSLRQNKFSPLSQEEIKEEEIQSKKQHLEDFAIEGDINSILRNIIVLYLSYEIKIATENSFASENIMRQTITKESLKKLDEIEEANLRKERKVIKNKNFKKVLENFTNLNFKEE